MIVMPPPDSEETIVAADGLKLHLERFLPAGAPRAVLVFVHGFSAHGGNFRHLGRACADAGFATTLFDGRGHGRSEGRRGYVRRFSDYTDDLALVLAGARACQPGLPAALAAHSQGALVCLDYLLRAGQPAPVERLAIAAPFLRLRLKVARWKLLSAPLLGRLWPTYTESNELRAEDVTRNPEVLAEFDRDPLVHHVATPRWFNEVRGAQARVMAAAPRLTTPTLMLLAGQDRIVSTEVALDFARAAGPLVEVRMYDNLFHEMFLEPERAQVIGDLVGWLAGAFGR
jgi:alpha-beta hydrolase superfamily lysophospholipase